MSLTIIVFFALAAGLSFLCKAHVVIVLRQQNSISSIVPALLNSPRTFISGWQHAEPLGITRTMTIWSFTMSAALITLSLMATANMNQHLLALP